MTPCKPVRITEGLEVFIETDFRAILTSGVLFEQLEAFTRGRAWQFCFSIAEVKDGGRRVFEVALHRLSPTLDLRCVFARFRNIVDARRVFPVLVDAWIEYFDAPLSPGGRARFTPSLN